MGNFNIPENPTYTEEIRKFETTDEGHADLLNAVVEPLVNNDAYLKKITEEHIEDKNNPHGIKFENLPDKPTIPAAVRVKGNAETTYHTGDVNITPANIGLGNVDNTEDSDKNVNSAVVLRGWPDTRNVATTPNDYNSTFKCVGIKVPEACGLSDGSNYYTLFGVRGYENNTGGRALEIAVGGNSGKLYFRTGLTTWDAWKTFADLTSTVSKAEILANTRTIFGKNFNGSGNVAGQGIFYGTYMEKPNNRYNNSGLQIYENGQVGSSQSDIAYAPAIGFHWSNRVAGMLAMDSTGTFHLFKQDGVTPANLDAVVTKATQDGNGNNIPNTYARKDDVVPYGVVTSGDFNDMTTPGIYTMSGVSTNAPTSDRYWGLIVLRSTEGSTAYIEQIAIREGIGEVYVRCKPGPNKDWNAWARLVKESDLSSYQKKTTNTQTSTAGGSITFNTPYYNNCTEIHVSLISPTIGSSPRSVYSWVVEKSALQTYGSLRLIDGYKSGDYEGFGAVDITTTSATINNAKWANTDYKSGSILRVDFR